MSLQSLSQFLRSSVVDNQNKVYTIDNFTITNTGVVREGSTGADQLIGTARNDILWGNGGADLLTGGGGRDLLTGGAGNDRLFGGTGDDRLQGWGDNDRLFGGAGRDALYGGQGSDVLYGGQGDDWLCGGSSFDQLHGGLGADVFVFRPDVGAARSTSLYLDFEIGKDKLRVDSDLMPDGFNASMIKTQADGDLYITTEGGHRMVFETLDSGDINALANSLLLI